MYHKSNKYLLNTVFQQRFISWQNKKRSITFRAIGVVQLTKSRNGNKKNHIHNFFLITHNYMYI